MNILMVIAYCLNLIGLCLDMYGVYRLFYTTDKEKGLEMINLSDKVKIPSPAIPNETDTPEMKILSNIPWYKDPEAIDFFNRLNDNIDANNEHNRRLKERSKKWLEYIIWGFALSSASVAFQLVYFLGHTNA